MSLTKEIYLCMALKMLSKDHVFVYVSPWCRWRNQRQTQYRTATLNSLGLKDKASLMPRGRNELKLHQLFRPLSPQRETYYTSFTDIWWFYRLKQLVKLSKSTQFCLPFCKVHNFCWIALAKIMYKLTSVLTSYVSIISDKLLCKTLLSDE